MEPDSFLIALKLLNEGNFPSEYVYNVLQSIEMSIEAIDVLSMEGDLLAYFIHKIFLKGPQNVRSLLLRIIGIIENKSNESIIEKFKYDFLIAMSIDQRIAEGGPKNEEDRLSAFKIIFLLLKKRNSLSDSVLRALAALYIYPNHQYHDLIINVFLEVSVYRDVSSISQIGDIIIDYYLKNPKPQISRFINYAIEEKMVFISDPSYFSRLIRPLTENNEYSKPSVTAIIQLLRHWPSLLHIGCNQKLIKNIIQSLDHLKETSLPIFSEIMCLAPFNNVLDGFSGLILSYIIDNGIVEQLDSMDNQIESVKLFMDNIRPYIYSGFNTKEKIYNNEKERFVATSIYSLNCFKRSVIANENKVITTITKFDLPADHSAWDWRGIVKILTVILPHNESESVSSFAKKLYCKLLDCFSTQYLSATALRSSLISEVLNSFIGFLSKSKSGWSQLASHSAMIELFSQTIVKFEQSDIIPQNSPYYYFYKFINLIISNIEGINQFSKHNFFTQVSNTGNNYQSVENADTVMTLININIQFPKTIELFNNFLNSPIGSIHIAAINQIRKRIDPSLDFCNNIFIPIFLPHLKKEIEGQKTPEVINLFSEIIHYNKYCHEASINDPLICELFSKTLLSCQLFDYANSSQEAYLKIIDYWMNSGNLEYVEAYDQAIEGSFMKVDFVPKFPSVVFQKGYALIPPHIFGMIAKYPERYPILIPYIKDLLSHLPTVSLRRKRAAFFAIGHFSSSPNTSVYLDEYKIIDTMINQTIQTGSYLLFGTLITTLSLFHQSKSLLDQLHYHQWNIFSYGNKISVIPNVIPSFFDTKDNSMNWTIPDIEGKKRITTSIRRLMSPITQNKAKEEIKQIYKEDSSKFNDWELADFGHRIMAQFSLSPDSRFFIEVLFKNTVPIQPTNLEVLLQKDSFKDPNKVHFINKCLQNAYDEPFTSFIDIVNNTK